MAAKPAKIDDELVRKRQNREHEQVITEVLEQLNPVFLHSPDGVYVYLDDSHKVCNKQMADMFGLTIEEWGSTPSFLEGFVAPEDQEKFAMNYRRHVGALARPVTFRFKAIRKNGETFMAETEMIPISWNGYALAYHFVREIR